MLQKTNSMEEGLMHMPTGVVDLMRPDQLGAMGASVRRYAEQNNLLVQFTKDGAPYCMVEGWQFAGGLLGLTPISGEPVRISGKENIYVVYHKVKKIGKNNQAYFKDEVLYLSTLRWEDQEMARWRQEYDVQREVIREYFNYKCTTDIVRVADGKLISRGHSTCSNLEQAKITFDEYAINSMSQTRSIGKGYRSIIGWIMKAAGIATTPLEEMEGFQDAKVEEVKDTRGTLDDKVQIPRVVEQIKAGKVDLEMIDRHYILTDAQRAILEAAGTVQASTPAEPEKPATAQQVQPQAPAEKKRRRPSKPTS